MYQKNYNNEKCMHKIHSLIKFITGNVWDSSN